ncbi:class I SAM-dependent methyltransferase [Peribacillus kribbensis]|uniref:class I SAM-dependent methyltransferase n=1 Tax=Peribacillus kribbensis TaxID=356658 RepID=UPI0005536374|nr:class I SAM-dependent methyltransferase [Peribacillus kribbensis]
MNAEQTTLQYKNSGNLDDRIQFHQTYSLNPKDWHVWLFESYHIPSHARILELGCGNGAVWAKNKDRIPESWDITLSDFSTGMLADAKKNIGEAANIDFQQLNAADIPFADHSFDVVMANHMLYHVPDRKKALQEIKRVLRPGGVLYSSTNGVTHMAELNEWVAEFDSELRFPSTYEHAVQYGLENGREQLEGFFPEVDLLLYEDGMAVPDTDAVIRYILSAGILNDYLTGEKLASFKGFLETKRTLGGGILKITKSSGLFVARTK